MHKMSADSGLDIAFVKPGVEEREDQLEKMREAWEKSEEIKYRTMNNLRDVKIEKCHMEMKLGYELDEVKKQNEELRFALQDQMDIIESLLIREAPKKEGLRKKIAEQKAKLDSMQNEIGILKKNTKEGEKKQTEFKNHMKQEEKNWDKKHHENNIKTTFFKVMEGVDKDRGTMLDEDQSERIENELHQLKIKYKEKEEDNVKLWNEVESMKDNRCRVESLEDKLMEMEALFEKKEERITLLKNGTKKFANKVKFLQMHVTNLEEENDRYQRSLAVSQIELKQMQEDYDAQEKVKQEFADKIKLLVEENQGLKGFQKNLECHITDLDAKYRKVRKEIKLMEKHSSALQKINIKLSDKISELGQIADNLQKDCNELEIVNEQLRSNCAGLENKMKSQVAKLENDIVKEHNANKERMQSLNLKVAELTQKLEDMTSIIKDTTHENENLNEAVTNQKDMINLLEEKIRTQIKLNAKDISEYEEQTSSLTVMMADLKAKNPGLANDNEDLEDAVGNLNFLVGDLNAKHSELICDNEDLQEIVANQRDSTYKLEEEIKAQRELYQKTLSTYEEQISSLKLQVTDLQSKQEEMIATRKDITHENENLKTTTTKQKEIISYLEESVDNLKLKLDELEQKKKGRIAKLFARVRRRSSN